jgi:hypothetical protein
MKKPRLFHLLRRRGVGDQPSEANKNGTFQSNFPRSATSAKTR